MKTYEITAVAALAAISAAVQIVHIGWMSPWGIWIDLVAIPWIVAYFLYGGRSALLVSVVGALIITFAAPSTWLGAGMKWLATMPVWFLPALLQRTKGLEIKDFRKPVLLIAVLVGAIILRNAIIIPVNYYFAIPIWTGWSSAQAMSFVPWWALFAINAVQTVLEMVVAWLLVFRFRMDRFASW